MEEKYYKVMFLIKEKTLNRETTYVIPKVPYDKVEEIDFTNYILTSKYVPTNHIESNFDVVIKDQDEKVLFCKQSIKGLPYFMYDSNKSVKTIK